MNRLWKWIKAWFSNGHEMCLPLRQTSATSIETEIVRRAAATGKAVYARVKDNKIVFYDAEQNIVTQSSQSPNSKPQKDSRCLEEYEVYSIGEWQQGPVSPMTFLIGVGSAGHVAIESVACNKNPKGFAGIIVGGSGRFASMKTLRIGAVVCDFPVKLKIVSDGAEFIDDEGTIYKYASGEWKATE